MASDVMHFCSTFLGGGLGQDRGQGLGNRLGQGLSQGLAEDLSSFSPLNRPLVESSVMQHDSVIEAKSRYLMPYRTIC